MGSDAITCVEKQNLVICIIRDFCLFSLAKLQEKSMNQIKPFKLTDKFLAKYKNIVPPFGFNGLGYLVYMRTYSRVKENGENEMWWETVRRVVEGTYYMQQAHMDLQGLAWDSQKAQKSAQEMYDRIFNMKFLPPGRGLWAMGSPITEEKGIYAALNNCSFISTENLKEDLSRSFCFLMDASMLGIGVGFDIKGAGKLQVKGPNLNRQTEHFQIPDTREGWVESLKLLLESYFLNTPPIEFDYEMIRLAGVPIKGFGGVASGPQPLKDLHISIREILNEEIGKNISSTAIVDIMNIIGKCVVAGNVRRTAEIVFGEIEDEDYLDLKNYKVNPRREEFGWTSNNSIFAKIGMDYKKCAERTKINGEPGYAWLDNMKAYSRMNNGPDNKDHRASGGNPCLEQTLESQEICNLVETFPSRHIDLEDYKRTLKYAYLYAKTVTLGKTHWPETNRVMLRNRRIGCSMSGIAQFITNKGLHCLKEWCEEGYKTIQYYDQVYSDWFAIPKSIKTTSIKPSGCRPWYSLTTTTEGILTLEELMENHNDGCEWSNYEGSAEIIQDSGTQKIIRTFCNGKSELLEIKLSYGLKLKSTLEHPWFVKKRYNRNLKTRYEDISKWVASKDLQPGDVIDIRLGVYNKTENSIFRNVNRMSISMRSDATIIKQPEKMNPDVAWLLGYLWGDGAMSPAKWRIRFSDENLFNLEKVKRIVFEQFGISNLEHKKNDESAYNLDVASKHLWHWLIKNDVWKYWNDNIDIIPRVVRSSSKEDILGFIAGLIDSDGCVSVSNENKKKITITTASNFFAEHLQHICWSIGLGIGCSHNDEGENYQETKSMYLLTLGTNVEDDAFRKLSLHSNKIQKINNEHPEIKWHHSESNGLIVGKVIKISEIEPEDTFDIEVKDSHWYFNGSVKSHNTVSLLAGATPGMHYPESRFYIRRVRLSKNSPLLKPLKKSGYKIEPAFGSEDSTMVVEIPVDVGDGIRTIREVGIWEQFALAAFLQRHWADNQVSCTVTFRPEEGNQIEHCLNYFQYQLKGISLLPIHEGGAYPQMPYEKIDENTYLELCKKLKKLDFSTVSGNEAEIERFCDGASCTLEGPLTKSDSIENAN